MNSVINPCDALAISLSFTLALSLPVGAVLYNKGQQQQEKAEAAAGKTPVYSKWAVLKSTLSIHTGLAARQFRAAGAAVVAGTRATRLADEPHGYISMEEGRDD